MKITRTKYIQIFLGFVCCLVFLTGCRKPAANGPESAYIQYICIDPDNSNIIYIATTTSGLYKSVDAGEQWVSINPNDKMRNLNIIERDAFHSARLIAGGRETGLLVSNNLGQSWESAGLDGMTICDIAIDPDDSNKIFVLAPIGVYRTMDVRKKEWELVFDHDEFVKNTLKTEPNRYSFMYTRFQKIAINPHDTQDIWLGARFDNGYYRSRDGGDTWTHESIMGLFRRVDPILFHPTDPGVVYVGTHHQGMFASFNNGISWVAMSRGLEPEKRTPYYGAFLISGIDMYEKNPDIMVTGSDYSNWKTVDGGKTWQEFDKSLSCEFARTMAIDPENPDVIYAGTNVGIYKTTDGGKTWVPKNNGFPKLKIEKSIKAGFGSKEYIYALIGKNRIYRKACTGDSAWLSLSWLLRDEIKDIAYDSTKSQLLLTTDKGIIKSNDQGFRWEQSHVEYTEVQSPVVQAPFDADLQNKNVRTLDVELQGKVFFEDSLVAKMYQNPPYISLQLVSLDYPRDKSVPLWTGNFDRYLKGKIQIPLEKINKKKTYLLYAEVRDFQRNTLTGYAKVKPNQKSVKLQLTQDTIFSRFEN